MTHTNSTSYRLWVLYQSPELPQIYTDVLLSLPNFPVNIRKHVLALARIQSRPIIGSPFWKQIGDARTLEFDVIDRSLWNGKRGWPMNLLDILNSLEEVSTPYLYSLLSLCTRSAPYEDYNSVIETVEKGIEKELDASVNVYHPVKLDYSAIFSGDTKKFSTPFYEGIPAEPEVAFSLYRDFCLARHRLRGCTLWPDITTKTVGDQVSQNFWVQYWLHDQTWKTSEKVSTADLERLYAEVGVKVDGPVEARSAWKYNELKPRIYFARGGTTYHASKYIQGVFNIILESFSEVAKVERYLEPQVSIAPSESSVVYDYESFTSSLEETKNFITAMAVFFDETEVTIIDSGSGPVQTTVGELLREYNAECNDYSEFDATRLVSDPAFRSLFHTCGMLGVPGNISSCTLLHGVLIRFIVGVGKGKSVGDDGKVYVNLGAEYQLGLALLFKHLKTIGRLQPTKVFDFRWFDVEMEQKEAYAYQFIKKPYRRSDIRMLAGNLFVLPNPFVLLGFEDGFHVKPEEKLHERLLKFAKGWTRFLVKFSQQDQDVLEIDQPRVYRFIEATRSRFLKEFPPDKRFGYRLSDADRMLRAPNTDLFGIDIGQYILAGYDLDDEIRMDEEFIEGSRGLGNAGETWVVSSSPLLSWMQKLGYVIVEDCYVVMTRRTYGDEYLKEVFRSQYKHKKIAHVVCTLPSWLRVLVP